MEGSGGDGERHDDHAPTYHGACPATFVALACGPGFGEAENRSRVRAGEESPNTTGRDAA
jgi:hypothetical protein